MIVGFDAEEERESHTVTILAEDNPAEMQVLEGLRTNPDIRFVDRVSIQAEELRRLGGDCTPHEPSRWVYYPWRSTAIRILGPGGYKRLRLDRNRNKITRGEQERLGEITVGVVGLSVGHAVAHSLALEGACGALRLADFDDLELSNLNRIPATLFDLGLNKAVVAARRIAELDPYLPVEVWRKGLEPATVEDFLRDLDVVVDECDSLDIKLHVRLEASRCGIPVVMETSDRGLLDVERFDLDPGSPPFHGLLGDRDIEELARLSNRDKVPHILRLLDAAQMSTRLAASMLEVDETLVTWPQLGSDVALGGAVVAHAIRRIIIGEPLASGRCRIDIAEHFERLAKPAALETTHAVSPPKVREHSDPVDAVLESAIRAPSGGNSQPWSIDVDRGCLVFTLADDPAPALMDLHRRGSCVAIGASLHNARVAAAAHQILGPMSIFPGERMQPFRDAPVAILEFGSGTDPLLAEQYGAALARATNRHPYDDRELSDFEIAALRDAAAGAGGRIRIVTDSDVLTRSAELLAESDRIRYLTRALRLEMIGELRWPDGEVPRHGIEVGSLGLDAAESAMLDVVLRHDVLDQLDEWGLGGGLGRITRDRVHGSAALVTVLSEGPAGADYVRAGMVMESVWLRAQLLGLSMQPISPIFLYSETVKDLETLAPRHVESLLASQAAFAEALGLELNERPALVLRIGRTSHPAFHSGRRKDRIRR